VPVPTALLHWNGCVWSPVASGTSAVLNAVWGSAPNDVWAVGGGSSSGPTDGNFGPGVILHWNGSVWSSASWSPPPGDRTVLQGVWGSGPDDVWAVGGASMDPAQQTVVLHWDGNTWKAVDLNGLTPDGLNAVWGSGPNDVWAVGAQERDLPQSAIVHWDGSAWSMVLCPITQPLSAVWGSGPSDVWAASRYQGGSVIIHWDGSVWSVWWSETNSEATTTEDEVSFASLWGSGSADVWAVANYGNILHWDGSAWSKSPSGTAWLARTLSTRLSSASPLPE
jgi:hypothetical protein